MAQFVTKNWPRLVGRHAKVTRENSLAAGKVICISSSSAGISSGSGRPMRSTIGAWRSLRIVSSMPDSRSFHSRTTGLVRTSMPCKRRRAFSASNAAATIKAAMSE